MNAAEQIIDMHEIGADPLGRPICKECGRFDGSPGAHVVAALTNAGHLLLTPDDVERLSLALVYTNTNDVTRVPLQVLHQRIAAWAAARVAEGGERGE